MSNAIITNYIFYKRSDGCIRDLGFNPRLHQKTNWCLSLMIKSFYQEQTPKVNTLSKKKKKNYIFYNIFTNY